MTRITPAPLSARDISAMTVYATDLAQAYPQASPHALADKLLTVFEGSPRRDRLEVACTAIEAAASLLAA